MDTGMDTAPNSSQGPWTVEAIATVVADRTDLVDDAWDSVRTEIRLLPPFDERSVQGLEDFSHLEVIYLFDRVERSEVHVHARRPRGNPDWPEVGILAQRAKFRTNRIGVSTCELVQVDGTTLHVRGLDAVDGTPVLDIKPWFREFSPRTSVRQPSWVHELMANYF